MAYNPASNRINNVLFYLELVSEVSSALIDDIRAATSSKSTFRQPHDEASFETSSGKSRAPAVALSLPLSGSVEGQFLKRRQYLPISPELEPP